MKKIIVSLLASLVLCGIASAQDNAAGIRIGALKGFGVEASYQHYFGDINRAQADLGVRFYHHSVAATLNGSYQWHWFLTGGLGVYGGPDLQLALSGGRYFNLGLGGIIGVDYQFDVPIQLSLDFRPTWNFFYGILHGFDPYIGLGVRYAF